MTGFWSVTWPRCFAKAPNWAPTTSPGLFCWTQRTARFSSPSCRVCPRWPSSSPINRLFWMSGPTHPWSSRVCVPNACRRAPCRPQAQGVLGYGLPVIRRLWKLRLGSGGAPEGAEERTERGLWDEHSTDHVKPESGHVRIVAAVLQPELG